MTCDIFISIRTKKQKKRCIIVYKNFPMSIQMWMLRRAARRMSEATAAAPGQKPWNLDFSRLLLRLSSVFGEYMNIDSVDGNYTLVSK